MNIAITNIWDMLEDDTEFWVLTDQSLLLVEPEEDAAYVRLFLNEHEVSRYESESIEKNDLAPSKTSAERLPLKQIFDLKEELTVLASSCYDKPLKIVVAQMYKDFIISEEEIFNSEVPLH